MVAENDDAEAVRAAALLSGTLGDVLAGYDKESVDVGRLAGRVETLAWAESEIKLELGLVRANDKYADTRGLESLLARVRDSLRAVQDGSGAWAGFVRSQLEDVGTRSSLSESPPDGPMGGGDGA